MKEWICSYHEAQSQWNWKQRRWCCCYKNSGVPMEIVEKMTVNRLSQPCYSATDAVAAVVYLVVYQQIFLRLLSNGLNFLFQLRHAHSWHLQMRLDREIQNMNTSRVLTFKCGITNNLSEVMWNVKPFRITPSNVCSFVIQPFFMVCRMFIANIVTFVWKTLKEIHSFWICLILRTVQTN